MLFTWKGNEDLKEQVKMAGEKYRDEGEKIQGKNRANQLFSAVSRANHNLPYNPEMKDFVEAYQALDALKEICCFQKDIDITLVSLTSLPEGEKYEKEREIREKNFQRAKNAYRKIKSK